MNEALKNIFDDKSMSAIANAAEIAPCPNPEDLIKEQKQQKQKTEMSSEPQVVYNTDEIEDLKELVNHQSRVLNRVIASQNEMIKELSTLRESASKPQAVVVETEEKPVEEVVIEEQPAPKPKKEAPKQQNGACEGLNPDDFCVEKCFYFGNK